MKFSTIFIMSFLIISSFKASADDHSNARGIGLSKASLVSSSGINAYGINPANYYNETINKKKLPTKPTWEISIMSLGGGYGSDSSIVFYNNYLQYLSINRETFTNLFTDINSVLNFRQNILPNQRTDVNYDFELKWFSVNFSNKNVGAFNFTIADKVGLNTNVLGRDGYFPLNFLITFNENGSYNLTNVNLNQSEATAWWIRKYNVAYARQFDLKGIIKFIRAGISIGLVHGFGNVLTYNSSLNINTYGIQSTGSGTHIDSISGKQNFYTQSALTDFFRDYKDGAKSHFTFFPKPAGKGYSIDLGVTVQFGEKWAAGLSITEIGRIRWDYNTINNYDTNSFIYRDFILSKSDPTYNRFVNDLDGLDTRDTNNSFRTNMPTKYRAGLMYRPSDKLMLEANIVKGDNNLPGNSTSYIYSFGSEYYPLIFLPLRAGFSVGGPEGFNIAAGAGLRLWHIELDFAAGNLNKIWKLFKDNNRVSLAFSSKLIF